MRSLNPLRANPENLPTICLSVFDHFSGLALKELSLKTPSTIEFLLFKGRR